MCVYFSHSFHTYIRNGKKRYVAYLIWWCLEQASVHASFRWIYQSYWHVVNVFNRDNEHDELIVGCVSNVSSMYTQDVDLHSH